MLTFNAASRIWRRNHGNEVNTNYGNCPRANKANCIYNRLKKISFVNVTCQKYTEQHYICYILQFAVLWQQQKGQINLVWGQSVNSLFPPQWTRAPPIIHLVMRLWIMTEIRSGWRRAHSFPLVTSYGGPAAHTELYWLHLQADGASCVSICTTVWDIELRRLQSLAKN